MEFNISSEKRVNVEAALMVIYSEIEYCIVKNGCISIFGIHDIYSEITGDYNYQLKFVDNCYGYTNIDDIHVSFGPDWEYDPVLNEYTTVYKAKLWFSEPKLLC